MKHLGRFVVIAFIAGLEIGITQTPQAKIRAPGGDQIEPGIYRLSEMFRLADRVGLVKVISGTTEAYDVAIYKAQVVQGFKGLSAGEIIYFGPYIAIELGSEYILFLRDNPKAIEPKAKIDIGYGTVHYSAIFDEGYSSMRTSYECVFDGATVEQRCDYGVRVCTDYVKLSKFLRAFPDPGDDLPSSCRWVRKKAFMSVLGSLGEKRLGIPSE